MTALNIVVCIVAAIAVIIVLLRSLKIAQLEHYIPGSVSTTLNRWNTALPGNFAFLLVAAVMLILSVVIDQQGFATGAVLAASVLLVFWPADLSVRGLERSAKFTRRLVVVAALSMLLLAILTLVIWVLPRTGIAVALGIAALFAPLMVDVALIIAMPIESAIGQKYATEAARTLAKVGPTTVAITGSFGKTTTKEYLATLLSGIKATVPSPASFNNKAGLSRAVSERLEPGTEVFIAEMGTYGKGEIAALCQYFPPDVSVFCALGPVHLERMKTLQGIVEAKSEIFQPGKPAVINVDYPLLAALADRHTTGPVIRVATDLGIGADVTVLTETGGFEIDVRGQRYTAAHPDAPSLDAQNLASALGAVLALGVDPALVLANVAKIVRPKNRRAAGTAPGGWLIVDDTFNSNPAGARAATNELRRRTSGVAVVVTPGMVELGRSQAIENEAWIAHSAGIIDRLIIVGHTNRKALISGAKAAGIAYETVESREKAVQMLRSQLGAGDGVLYENDLPVHYP